MPENSNRLCISYMFSLIAAAVILVATNSAWEIPIGSAAVFVALLWASSLSVINLHSTVVVMVLPVMMISVMKYDAGTTALVAAIGSLSLQEYRILVECNPAGLAVLKMVCNRAIIALCALASYAVFHLVWPYLAPDFSSIRFLLAAIASGLAWVLVSGVTVNLHVMLSQPQFRFRLDPGVV